MLKLSLTAGTTTASTAIAFTKVFNTNSNLSISGSTISVAQPGIYEITGTAIATSTAASSTGVAVYANNAQVDTAGAWTAAAIGETQVVPIYALLNVTQSTDSDQVAIQLMPVGAATIVSGTIGIKRIS